MKNIKNYFLKKTFVDYSFSIIVGIFILCVSILFYQTQYFKILLLISCIFVLFVLTLLAVKLSKLNKFLNQITFFKNKSYRIFENTLLFEDAMISYSFEKYVLINYLDINLVRHEGNVFEVTRPGYKGNHKVYIKSNDEEILIPVNDSDIAQSLMNFLETKNNHINFQNKKSKFIVTNLFDLPNNSVIGRF
ncbi:MAG: hypothetical protein RR734_04910 [Bacilli bacterium]